MWNSALSGGVLEEANQGNAAPAPLTRRPISPLENKENATITSGGSAQNPPLTQQRHKIITLF